jgi:hypothetical protein
MAAHLQMNTKGQATKKLIQSTSTGTLGLDQTTNLAGKGSDDGLRFTFEYSGFLFAVHATANQQGTNMQFRAHLGHLPYTAEDPHARSHAMHVLRSASRALGGRVGLSTKQHIMLQDTIIIDEPFTPVLLMSRTAKLLVLAKPYLELLSQFVQPPSRHEALRL